MSDSPPSWTRLVLLILIILISIESPFRSSTDIRRFATVQRTAYGVQGTRVGERSAHLRMAVRALSLFASVPLRRDLQFSFSFFLFLFSFLFFFSTSIGRQLVATATRRLLGFAFFILCLSAPLPQRARSPAWQAAPAYGNARDKCHATRYSAGHPSITDVSSISFSCCLCALFVSAQRTRLAESLRLYDCRDKSGVAPPPDRTLPTDSFKYNSIGNNHDMPVPTMHRGRGGNLLVSCLYSVL